MRKIFFPYFELAIRGICLASLKKRQQLSPDKDKLDIHASTYCFFFFSCQ